MSIVIDSRIGDGTMLYPSMEQPENDTLDSKDSVISDASSNELMEDQMSSSNDHLEDGPQKPQHIIMLDRNSSLGKRDHPSILMRTPSETSILSVDSNASPRSRGHHGLRFYSKKKQKICARQRKRQLERKFGTDFRPGTIRHRLNFLQHSFGDQLALIEESLPKTFFRVMSLETFIRNKMEQHALDATAGSFRRSPESRRKTVMETHEMAEIMTFSPLEMPQFESSSPATHTKQVHLKPRSTSSVTDSQFTPDESVMKFLNESPPPSPNTSENRERVLPPTDAILVLPPTETPMLVSENDPTGASFAAVSAPSDAPAALAKISSAGIVEDVVQSPTLEKTNAAPEQDAPSALELESQEKESQEKESEQSEVIGDEMQVDTAARESAAPESLNAIEIEGVVDEPITMPSEGVMDEVASVTPQIEQEGVTEEVASVTPQTEQEGATDEVAILTPQIEQEGVTDEVASVTPQIEQEGATDEVASVTPQTEQEGATDEVAIVTHQIDQEGVMDEVASATPQTEQECHKEPVSVLVKDSALQIPEIVKDAPSRQSPKPGPKKAVELAPKAVPVVSVELFIKDGVVVDTDPMAVETAPESPKGDPPTMAIDTGAVPMDNSAAPSTPVADQQASPAPSAGFASPRPMDAVERARREQATPVKVQPSESDVMKAATPPTPDAVERARLEQLTPIKGKISENDPAASDAAKPQKAEMTTQSYGAVTTENKENDISACASPNSVMNTELGENEEKVKKQVPLKENRKIRFADEEGQPLTKEYLLQQEANYASRIVVMLLSPRDRKFEFLHAEYPADESTTVQVLLEQVPFLATNDAFRTKTFNALLQTETSRQLDNNLALQDYRFKESEIVLGIPDDFTVANMTKMAVPLLLNKKLMRTVKQAIRKGRGLKTVQSGEEWTSKK